MTTETFDFPASRGMCPFAPPAAVAQVRRDTPVRRITLWDGTPFTYGKPGFENPPFVARGKF